MHRLLMLLGLLPLTACSFGKAGRFGVEKTAHCAALRTLTNTSSEQLIRFTVRLVYYGVKDTEVAKTEQFVLHPGERIGINCMDHEDEGASHYTYEIESETALSPTKDKDLIDRIRRNQ